MYADVHYFTIEILRLKNSDTCVLVEEFLSFNGAKSIFGG
jgi:hypothetical protein